MIVVNIYNIGAKVRATQLTGLDTALTGVITSTDTVLQAFGKIQNQITNIPIVSPGASDRQVQFNNAGVFGGAPEMTWFPTNRLSLGYVTPVDAGFRLDVNGTARITSSLSANTLSSTSTTTIRGMVINEASNIWTFTTPGSSGSIEFRNASGTLIKFKITNLGDAIVTRDLLLNTAAGSKIGGAGALLAFYDNTPIAKPTTAYASATYVNNAGTAITDTDTFDGYTLRQIVRILKDLALT